MGGILKSLCKNTSVVCILKIKTTELAPVTVRRLCLEEEEVFI